MVEKSPQDAMRSHIDFKEQIELIGNTDIGIQSKKRTEAYQFRLNKERAKEIIRESCQNMCSMFNLFRGRSRFVYMLLEDILSNYSIKLIDSTARYEECVDMVTGVVQMLVGHISQKIEKNPTVRWCLPKEQVELQKAIEEIVEIKSNVNFSFEEIYSLLQINQKKVTDISVKLKKDEIFCEYYKKMQRFYTNFSTGFSLGSRALVVKINDLSVVSDSKTNLWYNEFRTFLLLKSFPKYYMKEYTYPLIKMETTMSSMSTKFIQHIRQLLSHCGSLDSQQGNDTETGLIAKLKRTFAMIIKDKKTDMLQMVSPDYQSVIKRTLGEDNSDVCLLGTTKRFIKFFETYTIKLKPNYSLFEYVVKGSIVEKNTVINVFLIIDVGYTYSELRHSHRYESAIRSSTRGLRV